MGVCTACHTSKVKCDKNTPCARCVRLKMECMPHISQQGRRKKGIPKQNDSQTGAMSSNNDDPTKNNNQQKKNRNIGNTADESNRGRRRRTRRSHELDLQTENCFVKTNDFSFVEDASSHYGLNHILRQWISLAFCRRTFRLLEVASGLANKYGIPMDRIICGKGMPPEWIEKEITVGGRIEMYDLPNVILQPKVATTTGGIQQGNSSTKTSATTDMDSVLESSPLLLEEIPIDILKLMRCVQYKATGDGKRRSHLDLGDRWITVREMKCGRNRFFVSDGFARNIITWSKLQQTYKDNEIQMIELWMPDSKERARYSQSLVHQVTQYHTPDEFPPPDRVASTKIVLNTGETVIVDSIFCYRIMSLDRCFASLEYIPSTQLQQKQLLQQQQQQQHFNPPLLPAHPLPQQQQPTSDNLNDDTSSTSEVLHDLPLDDDVDNNDDPVEDLLFGDIPEFHGQFDGFDDWLKDAFERQQNFQQYQ